VESLRKLPQLPVRIRQRIRRRLWRVERDVEAWSQECATILARLTTNLAIVTVPRARSPRRKHIQLVYLQEFQALLTIVLQEARLLRRLLPLEESLAQDLLTQTANRLNEHFGGLNHAEMEARQVALTPLEERVKRDAVATLREAETHASLQHYADGLRLLLSQPDSPRGTGPKRWWECWKSGFCWAASCRRPPRLGK
jgi:transcriptional regulator of heat shock response